MKTQVKFLSVVLTAAVCTNLTACGALGGANNSNGSENVPPYEIDAYGTVTRGGEQINVCVCHDQKAVYLYFDDEKHELFDKAMLPTDELYDTDWELGVADFDDVNGDNNSDLQVYLSHSDMSESHIEWHWEEDAGYVYQPDYSRLHYPIVIYDPLEDAVYYDYSMYEGLWLSDEDNLYPDQYLQFDANGNWTLFSDGEEIDNGYLWYDAEENLTYVTGYRGGAIDGGSIEVDGDRLNITGCGYFNYLDGRGGQWQGDGGSNWDGENRENIETTTTDFSMYEGLWLSDEVNLYPDTYLLFDAEGNWTLTKDGETIDEGYLKYDADEGGIYTYSKRGGDIDGGFIQMEGDQLNINICGYFNYLDGRSGQWQGDGGSNWDGEER